MKVKAIIGKRNSSMEDSDFDEIEGILGDASRGMQLFCPYYRTNSTSLKEVAKEVDGRNYCVTSMPWDNQSDFIDPQKFFAELNARGYTLVDAQISNYNSVEAA
jgi:hypothetical protein